MEARLQKLVNANSTENRDHWAQQWKRQGKKVIGTLCSYVPEEVIHAAGMLPWRVTGTWRETVHHATVYYPESVCAFCTHVLEEVLVGKLDFLDGVVATNWDQDLVRLWDIWSSLGKLAFTDILQLPHDNAGGDAQALAREIERLKQGLGGLAGRPVTAASLGNSVAVYNEKRRLLKRLYELRKRAPTPVSGAECLGIVTASTIMPVEEFNRELGTLLPYLEERQVPDDKGRLRLLVSGDRLDELAYIRLLETLGAVVAMDDLDTGSRYFWEEVAAADEDRLLALAKRYLARPACPRMMSWEEQAKQVIDWVREYQADGVIEYALFRSRPRLMRAPSFTAALARAGIPVTTIYREYHFANEGQLRTRVQAFYETLASQRSPVQAVECQPQKEGI